MINPGMLINRRYEIIDLIGSGGMADVYKASDTRLNRMVAVKILKQEFSNDKNFITRFKNEAQSAAGLSHPNIVSVYDVGDDEGYHYIVMELVEGITLKKFIEKKGRLEVRESVGISIQIAQGMEAAHDNHIIHRDIKPQNIIISRDGKVKVADFGIAKVVSNDTFTQTAVGSVHYLSPEQARGGYSDERSDIYSLGVTLYEMLTGQLPFAGESDVTVALAHIQNQAKPARELVPSIPYALDRVVQKCMQKHPENRYSSASDLIIDLKHSITNPDGDFVTIDDGSDVVSEPTKRFTQKETDEIKKGTTKPQVKQEKARPAKNTADSKVLREELEELDTIDSKWEKAIMIISIIFVFGVCGALFYGITHLLDIGNLGDIVSTPTPQPTAVAAPSPTPEQVKPVTITMPYLYGQTFADAERILKSMSPSLQVLDGGSVYDNEIPEGLVVKQYPLEGTDVLPDMTVKLTLSAGGEPKFVPRVIGLSMEAAKSQLSSEGFLVGTLSEPSDIVPSGCVIRTEPAQGEQVRTGDKIVIYVSSGTPISYTEIPSLIGKTAEAAILEIESCALVLGEIEEDYSNDFTEGYVIWQSAEARQIVLQGLTINIRVSKGPYPEGYVPTPTPTPITTFDPGQDNPGLNPDGSQIDPVTGEVISTGRKYFVVRYDTTGMANIIDPVDGNWMTFEIEQDGAAYSIVIDYSVAAPDCWEGLFRAEDFERGFVFRLYSDYGDYGLLHEGTAMIVPYCEGIPLEAQMITLVETVE